MIDRVLLVLASNRPWACIFGAAVIDPRFWRSQVLVPGNFLCTDTGFPVPICNCRIQFALKLAFRLEIDLRFSNVVSSYCSTSWQALMELFKTSRIRSVRGLIRAKRFSV